MSTTFQRTGIEEVDRSLSGVVDGVRDLERLPWNAGRLIEGAIIGTTDTAILHGLGRTVRGYAVVRASVAASVFDGSPSPTPMTLVNLRASTPVTVSLLVF